MSSRLTDSPFTRGPDDVRERYVRDGFARVEKLVPREVATAMLARLQTDLARQGVDPAKIAQHGPLLIRPAVELYGYHYPLFSAFHWGLTPMIADLLSEDLLPTYCYFRLYRSGDRCKVHGDRPACEHSLSLTLGYADELAWPLEVARERTDTPYQRADDNFAPEERASSVDMLVGDGVLYQGVHHHHGRTTPNPNRWSAHIFLHWVGRDGPYADQAFDKQPPPASVDF